MMFLFKLLDANKNSLAIANAHTMSMEDTEELMLDEKWIEIVNNDILISNLLDKYLSTHVEIGERNVDILVRFYGLFGVDVESMENIANAHGIHINTVSNVLTSVISALRKIYESSET
jgi:hypothetical protein